MSYEKHGREFASSFMSSGGELSTEWWCVEDIVENAPIVSEWISVDYDNPESLPSKSKSVLYCAFGRSVGEGYYRGFDGYHHVWKMYACCGTHWDDEVTHWMPLPEPPEVK